MSFDSNANVDAFSPADEPESQSDSRSVPPRRPRRAQKGRQPRQERSRGTVQFILEAAAKVLTEDGYHATTTTRVAQVAGVSVGSLYQYFPSKEALLLELVDRHIARILEMLQKATAELRDAPFEEAVRVILRALVRAHSIEPKLHAVLTRHFSDFGGIERVRELNGQAVALLHSYLETQRLRLRPTDLKTASFVIVQSVQAVLSASVMQGLGLAEEEKLVDDLSDLVLRFLMPIPNQSEAHLSQAPGPDSIE